MQQLLYDLQSEYKDQKKGMFGKNIDLESEREPIFHSQKETFK